MRRRLLRRTGPTGLGGTGSPAPGGGRSLLQGPWGGVFFGEPGPPAWGGRGVQPQEVVGASFKAHGEASSSENRAHRPGGDGGSSPRGWSEPPSRPMGRRHLRRTGPTGLGGTGSPTQGVVGASFQAHGEASSSENRAHRPGGDGESSPRGWSEPPSRPMGRRHLRRTGPTGLGGTGSPAQGVVGASFKAHGGASSSENRAHRPRGDGESSPGGGRKLLQGPWGGVTGLPCCAGSPALEPLDLSPCTAPLLGRGPLTSVMSSLWGPLYPHTWTPAMKTPHWSLLGFAPGLLRSRGRPPMRGRGGAPHGRCQPARGVWAVCEGGGGQRAETGRGHGAEEVAGSDQGRQRMGGGGHRGARRGGGRGGGRGRSAGGAHAWAPLRARCVGGRVGGRGGGG